MSDPIQGPTALKDLLKSEGVLLAAVPFAGSLLTAAYEAGYLSFYDVPLTLAQFDFTHIVIASVLVALVVGFLIVLLLQVSAMARGRHPLRRAAARLVAVYIVFGTLGLLVVEPYERGWFFGILLVLPLAVYLVLPALRGSSGENYLRRLSRTLDQEEASESKVTKSNIYLISALIFFGAILTISLGRFNARQRLDYWVNADKPTYFLVASYGDLFIFKSFDPGTKQVGNELFIVKFSEDAPLRLVRRRIGALKPPPPRQLTG